MKLKEYVHLTNFLTALSIYKHSKNIPTKESLQTAYPKTNEEKYWDDILGV